MEKSNKIAVIGGGSWATALVKILCNNVPVVNWWMRNDEAVEHIHKFKHNPNYLQSGIPGKPPPVPISKISEPSLNSITLAIPKECKTWRS
jgi:glycerol-3-phosphate dehydrogenase